MRHERLPIVRGRQIGYIQLATILLLALALAPAASHVFALNTSYTFNPENYLAIQKASQASSILELMILLTLVCTAAHAFIVRDHNASFRWSLPACGCLVASLLLVWSVVAPAEELTQGWNTVPATFEIMRTKLEWAYATIFSLEVAALAAFVMSMQAGRPYIGFGIIDAIGADIKARTARARALAGENVR